MISVSLLGMSRNRRTFRLRGHDDVIRAGSCERVSDYGGFGHVVWECEEAVWGLAGGGLGSAAKHGVGEGGGLGLIEWGSFHGYI